MTASAQRAAVPASNRITESLDAAAMFAGFERDGFHLRNPVSRTDGLYSVTTAGDCLTPVIVEGDHVHIEMGAQPQHGDLALVQWTDEVIKSWSASERSKQWAARFGAMDMSRGLKLCWDFPLSAPDWARSRYWVCRENLSRAKNAAPLGVVRAVERGGILLRGDIVHRPIALSGIDENAATSVADTTAASVTVSSSSSPSAILSLAVGPFAVATTLVCTATTQWQFSTATNADNIQAYGAVLNGGLGSLAGTYKTITANLTSSGTVPAGDSISGTFSDEQSYSLAVGATTTIYFGGACLYGYGTSTFKFLLSMLKVEAIKR
jgi:hypothetical protein